MRLVLQNTHVYRTKTEYAVLNIESGVYISIDSTIFCR